MVDELFSPFLGTTVNIPEEEDRLNSFLVDQFSNYADVINQKRIGVITQAENFNGELWGYATTRKQRNGYQIICYITSFLNPTTTIDLTTIIPQIAPQFVITQVWGSASLACSAIGVGDGDYFSFMAQGDTRVSFTMSDTSIVITTTVPMTAYTGFIVINYLRDGT